MNNPEVLRMEHISKVYPNGVLANSDVNFAVNEGEIHALSGENGAGKSTLMKILFGEEQATGGDIFIRGEKVHIASSATAIRLGIGMVHQHFMLVPSLTVTENMILGIEPRRGLVFDQRKAERLVLDVVKRYNLPLDPKQRVRDLTVGQKQKLEILKALVRGAKILILDEPTAVLTPQETRELFVELKALRNDGYTIIFISHKLGEVRELCDRITIIRHGKTMGVYLLREVTEQEISRLMVGRDVILDIRKQAPVYGQPSLRVRDLHVMDDYGLPVVKGLSFTARRGEILGIAGVEGNGQNQLVQALGGMRAYQQGSVEIVGKDIRGLSIHALRALKVCHIPEDRMTIGIAPGLSITENILADKVEKPRFSTRLGFMRLKAIRQYGAESLKRYGIAAKSPDVIVTSLSGGNIQKVVLARELSDDPEFIIADQPTRGVDVGATEFIRAMLIKMRDAGKTVFLISSDLNEILGLSDRLIVLFEGKIAAWFSDAGKVTEEELGRYMLGIDRQGEETVREAAGE
ncbi:MAG: ABC transporter ATP-binding protein [Spirochaetaceae bacterium]|nr:ABC transporter ATP-binding protein [Spirochaetaceae bacterium]